MYWEEKIDIIAKKHGPEGFKNPFTSWPDILKNIQQSFIIKSNDQYSFSDWKDNIKQKKELITTRIREIDNIVSSLTDKTNYWLVIVIGEKMPKHYVYDCNLAALKEVLHLSNDDFYIVDKKYSWLVYFQCNMEKREVVLFKSGISISPFDALVSEQSS